MPRPHNDCRVLRLNSGISVNAMIDTHRKALQDEGWERLSPPVLEVQSLLFDPNFVDVTFRAKVARRKE